MVNYRRNFVLDGTYFFTVTLRMRNSRQLVDSIDLLRLAFRKTREAKPFQIDAMVVLPEHLHSIWTLPPNDSDYPGRWKAIKSIFTRELEKSGVPVGKRKDGSALIWQRRYWEHTIRDADDLNRHIDYIHFNPVKHGLVERVIDWPYSSFHRYVRQGFSGKIPNHDTYRGGQFSTLFSPIPWTFFHAVLQTAPKPSRA